MCEYKGTCLSFVGPAWCGYNDRPRAIMTLGRYGRTSTYCGERPGVGDPLGVLRFIASTVLPSNL